MVKMAKDLTASREAMIRHEKRGIRWVDDVILNFRSFVGETGYVWPQSYFKVELL